MTLCTTNKSLEEIQKICLSMPKKIFSKKRFFWGLRKKISLFSNCSLSKYKWKPFENEFYKIFGSKTLGDFRNKVIFILLSISIIFII